VKEHSIEAQLAAMDPPPADPDARSAATRAALAEFARVHAANETPAVPKPSGFKALLAILRPTRADQQHGRPPMNWATRNAWYAGAASVCVATLGLMIVWPMLSHRETLLLPTTTPVAQPPKAAPATPVNVEPAAVATESQPKPVELPKVRNTSSLSALKKPASPSAGSAKQPEQAETIVVTGLRQTLQSSMDMKRDAVGVVDTITAEDIGSFPDVNLAERLRRIPGVAIDAQNRDAFEHFEINPLQRVADVPVSTFSVDVDTASYSFVRRELNDGVLPPKDAVRAEEMINYFDYAWPVPSSQDRPFQPTVVVSDSPWNAGRKLVHIAIKGYELPATRQPDANLVLLLDVSGSMDEPDKLPLVKQSMRLLLSSLKPTDTVAIVVYAGAAGMVLEPTEVRGQEKIVQALESLQPGGSTAGAEGIRLAYDLAASRFRKDAVNRILLATDGDFNVGITDTQKLKDYVERQREKGIFLSVLGFGAGNYRDEMAQALAQNGNGVAAYIDTVNEAQKVLVQEASGSLFTIAKDVKIQVEFNPAAVAEYRLVGYETRALKREDFNNDAVDAGDVGAGHTVTAIYEITPVGSGASLIDQSRYIPAKAPVQAARRPTELGYLKIRYKLPDQDKSRLIELSIPVKTLAAPAIVQREVAFSTAVAGFAQLLRGGTYTGSLSYEDIIRQAQAAQGEDRYGYRAEFVKLVKAAQVAKGM